MLRAKTLANKLGNIRFSVLKILMGLPAAALALR
jgi:hypothetical protein